MYEARQQHRGVTPRTGQHRKLDTRLAEAVCALVDTAMDTHDTLILAVHWLLYEWRSAPDAFELDARTRAVQRLVARMDDVEHTTWRNWLLLPPLERPAVHTL